MRLLCIVTLLFPVFSRATLGPQAEIKIRSKTGNTYLVETDQHSIKVDASKLPEDLQIRWSKNVGQKIESALPVTAVIEKKSLGKSVQKKKK